MNFPSRLAGLCFAMSVVAFGQTIHPVGNIFKPQAAPAESVYHLSLLVLTVCAAVFLVVAGGVSFPIVRFPRQAGGGPQTAPGVGRKRLEIAPAPVPVPVVFLFWL